MTDPVQGDFQNPSTNGSSTNNNLSPFPIDFNAIFARARDVIVNPSTCWQSIEQEAKPISEIYVKYYGVLAAVPALAQFIRFAIFGFPYPFIQHSIRWPLFSGIFFTLLFYVALLAMPLVFAVVVELVAPYFEATVKRDTLFRLAAYSSTPALLTGIGWLAPGSLLQTLIFLCGIYSLYILYVGFLRMTSAPESRQTVFFIASIVAVIIANGIIMMVVEAFNPRPPLPDFSDLGEKLHVSPDQIQKSIDRLQKLIPENP